MTTLNETTSNRILVVDDDALLLDEYVRCFGEDFDPEFGKSTLSGLEKVLFGDEVDESGAAR